MNIPDIVIVTASTMLNDNPTAKVVHVPFEDGWWLISRDGRSKFFTDWDDVLSTAPRWARLQGGLGETPAEQLADGPGVYTPEPMPDALPGDEPSEALATALRADSDDEVPEDA